jgi:hypothetical protein
MSSLSEIRQRQAALSSSSSSSSSSFSSSSSSSSYGQVIPNHNHNHRSNNKSTTSTAAPFDASLSIYQDRLSLYQVPPKTEITLTDFETFALDRLHVLKALENAAVRNKSNEDTLRIVKASTDKYLKLSLTSNNLVLSPLSLPPLSLPFLPTLSLFYL